MGKKKTGKKKAAQKRRQRKYLRIGVLSLLVVLGIGTMAAMAAFNGTAKPNRDMQWYVHQGAVQVAAPSLGEGFVEAEIDPDAAPAALAVNSPAASADAYVEGSLVLADRAAQTAELPVEAPDAELPDGESVDEAMLDDFGDEGDIELPDAQTFEVQEEPEENSGTVTLKLTAVGDCTLGGEIGAKGRRRFVDYVGKYGYDYFFSNVRHIFENDDLTIANLEGPLTSVEKPGKHGGFVFKGDPDYVKILTGSSVELCNVANNHTLDYGKAGLKETAEVLDANGVGYCGYTKAYNAVIKGVRVTALGFTWWDIDWKDITSAVAAAREGCDLLIVNIHWGAEGEHAQDRKQVALGHAIVDAGADLVIGTHPHVYQGIEKYKGKYIVYSLGNCCFAGNANPADKRCLIFQQTFSFNPGMGIAQANIMDAGINVIPCTVSSVKDKNDFRPTILTAEQGGALIKAVARQSANFSLDKTLWMKDNYMLTYGLIKPKEDLDADGNPVTADTPSDAAGGEASETPGEAEPGEASVT